MKFWIEKNKGEITITREVYSSEIKEIVLNPAYSTNKDFENLKLQGFEVRWMREEEGNDKDIFTLLIDE